MTDNNLTNLSAYRLSSDADCASPDTLESVGARFLLGIRDAVHEMLTDSDDPTGDFGDDIATIADDAVPIYTSDIWATFVDLGAYNEDPTEMGADGSDMEQAAKVCLYIIASRLADVLVAEHGADYVTDEEDDDETDDA